MAGLRGFEAFIYDCLQQGQLGYDEFAPVFRDVETHITNHQLINAYSQFRSVAGARYEDMKTTGMKQASRGVKLPPLDVMRANILAYHKIDPAHHDWDDIESADSAPDKANGKSVISGKETGWDSLSHFPLDDVPWRD